MIRFVALVMTSLVSVTVAQTTDNTFPLSILSNVGITAAFSVSSKSACLSNCSATTGCSAVSYSSMLQQCIKSLCANIQVAINGFWETIILVSAAVPVGCSSLPTARFDWMLTDTCGNSSNGYLTNVSAYSAQRSVLKTPSASAYMGNAFGGNSTFCFGTSLNPQSYNLTQSFTFFAYVYIYPTSGLQFSIFEFGYLNSGSYNMGPQFWIYDGGVFVKLTFLICSGTCMYTYTYTPPTNTWLPLAFVYDNVKASLSIYINGTLKSSTNFTAPLRSDASTPVWNYLSSGCRYGDNQNLLQGAMFCLKYFDQALTSAQLSNVITSCKSGKVRLT